MLKISAADDVFTPTPTPTTFFLFFFFFFFLLLFFFFFLSSSFFSSPRMNNRTTLLLFDYGSNDIWCYVRDVLFCLCVCGWVGRGRGGGGGATPQRAYWVHLSLVSRTGLAVRRLAGKQRDLGSNPLRALLSLQKLWFVDTVL